MEHPDQLEKTALLVKKDLSDSQEKMVPLVQQGRTAQQVNKVLLGPPVTTEKLAPLVPKVLLVQQVTKVTPVHKVKLDLMVLLDKQVLRARKVTPDRLVQLVLKV